MMRNLVISVLVVGLLSLLPLSPRVGPSSGLLPVSISLGQGQSLRDISAGSGDDAAGLSSRLSSLLLPLLLSGESAAMWGTTASRRPGRMIRRGARLAHRRVAHDRGAVLAGRIVGSGHSYSYKPSDLMALT